MPLFPVFPGEEVSDRPPRETRDLFWRTLETFKKISVNGHVIVNAARVRAALPHAWELVKRDILDFIGPNGASDTYNLGTVVENLSITLPITEFLLQSHEGLIRVFPGLPDSVSAQFSSLRARGGFTVNAAREEGATKVVELWHEQGGLCLIENPWGKESAWVTSGKGTSRRVRPNELGQLDISVPARKWVHVERGSK